MARERGEATRSASVRDQCDLQTCSERAGYILVDTHTAGRQANPALFSICILKSDLEATLPDAAVQIQNIIMPIGP